jgi:hypothetical protein
MLASAAMLQSGRWRYCMAKRKEKGAAMLMKRKVPTTVGFNTRVPIELHKELIRTLDGTVSLARWVRFMMAAYVEHDRRGDQMNLKYISIVKEKL